ncbi:IbpA Molecular chaperone (small heat shock protein) [Rhabdaerophilaceae bacterium]
MRTFDLAPLYRSTVGFDRLFALMNQLETGEAGNQSYPPYNIEKISEDGYRISLAVAGFAESDLSIETKENWLVIRGERKAETDKAERAFLFQGIAARQFERRFRLADHVNVTGAELTHGLLHVDLVREIPEAKKPRHVAISTGQARDGSEPAPRLAA